jgi:uncharacterized protein (DUF2126 family)/transglutaminase-like putative cysteine protease
VSTRVALHHRTAYRFDRPVAVHPHVVRLRPAPHTRTPIPAYSLHVTGPRFLNWQQDPFGNHQARLVFPEPMTELVVAVDLVAELVPFNPFDFFIEPEAECFPFDYEPSLAADLAPYRVCSAAGSRLVERLEGIDRTPRRVVDLLVEINQQLASDIRYLVRMEAGVQSCEETLEQGSGSCRDSAWLLVQILRHLGLAARFVSGYLVQLKADVPALDGPSGPEQDFTDLHAWAEVYLPGAGWVGLDATSGLFAAEGHIPLACTPHPTTAAAITGSTGIAEVEFEFENSVTRIHEDPRVTLPYTEEQWARVDALGRAVDVRLEADDVRLTMGGEPTFVSIDDRDGAEWHVAADGPGKRRLSQALLDRLGAHFGPGGVVSHGQGKWYPGEPLPRWSMTRWWRDDGVPLWRDPTLLAHPAIVGTGGAPAPAPAPDATPEPEPEPAVASTARAVAEALVHALGVGVGNLIPAYEDPLHHLWREGMLPVGIETIADELDDPARRDEARRIVDRTITQPTGWALPLAWDWARHGWRSSTWELRRGRLVLLPGDSPMGLRLPLDALPVTSSEDRDPPVQPDPVEMGFPLPDPAATIQARVAAAPVARVTAPAAPVAPGRTNGHGRSPTIRTALCVEPRAGRVHVFLPPVTALEHWVDLLAAIESAAATTGTPVVLEGDDPPRDPRLVRLAVTPDPGVIEVNVHPSRSWPDLVDVVTTLYDEAHQSRLGTERFQLDGRHQGTGGGNHLTIGGHTPADSPLLRRPDVLASLVTFWQHHPGLSYLFAGTFVGPTSQSPRVDEARTEALYELEIALQQLHAATDAGPTPPWLADRALRHLLVDLTGNTHRAELCIDKLYSPDSASGRLGLLELRAFEMPPHARMSLVQQLLVRSLVARFWREPYRHPLVRWGTELHDRFLLPHWVEADLDDVVGVLNDSGLPFESAWLAPFTEFRFPRYGTVEIGGITVELRQAIEPWPVLGEEVVSGGTARFVDSSLERLQVTVTGLTDTRHVVACNGRRLPLRPTGEHGTAVAGVRFRAWQPASALHPTIGVHAPLVFDVVDTWTGRAVGGCTYHVSHPGGLSYDTFPVNALEADARRVSRFWDHGYTPGPLRVPPSVGAASKFLPEGSYLGPMEAPPAWSDPWYPGTLDLRRVP